MLLAAHHKWAPACITWFLQRRTLSRKPSHLVSSWVAWAAAEIWAKWCCFPLASRAQGYSPVLVSFAQVSVPSSVPSSHCANSTSTLATYGEQSQLLCVLCFPCSPKMQLWSGRVTEKATVKRVSWKNADSVSLFDRLQTKLRQKVETKCRYTIREWCAFSLYLASNYTIPAKITDAAIKTCILIWEHKNN